MTYYNPVFHYGEGRFVADAANAGVDGLIIPDLPPEEAGSLIALAEGRLDTIFLLAPTSTPEREKLVASVSRGFIYYVSLTGITGARTDLAEGIAAKVAEVRHYTKLPVAVGFGISTPEQAGQVASFADGVIVGSALVGIIEKYGSQPKKLISQVKGFVGRLKAALPKTR